MNSCNLEGRIIMIVTYFVLLALFWAVGLLIWKKSYVTKDKEEADE